MTVQAIAYWVVPILIGLLIAIVLFRKQSDQAQTNQDEILQRFVDLTDRSHQDRLQGAKYVVMMREIQEQLDILFQLRDALVGDRDLRVVWFLRHSDRHRKSQGLEQHEGQ